MVDVAYCGPHCVVAKTISNNLITSTTLKSNTIRMNGRSMGIINRRNTKKKFAPSTCAASKGSLGNACIPLISTSATKGVEDQISTNATTRRDDQGVANQANRPSPKIKFTGPLLEESMTFHMRPEMTGGNMSGSKSKERIKPTHLPSRFNNKVIKNPKINSPTSAINAIKNVVPRISQKMGSLNIVM